MDKIVINELEVFYHIGVPDEERANPQRLLLTIEMEHNFQKAQANDELKETINYFAVSQRLLTFGTGRNWKLLETLAGEISHLILTEFRAAGVTVEIKKFIIPECRHVSVRIHRQQLKSV